MPSPADIATREVVISRLKIGLVGAGGMGSNHARVVAESDFAELGVIVDLDLPRASEAATRFGCDASDDLAAIAKCDAAIIATSTPSHVAVATQLLAANLPLLIEKPVAENADDVTTILDVSRAAGLPVMCGFVERFNPALTTAVALLDTPVIQLQSVRHSPQNPFASSTVVQDLLIHDIDTALRVASSTDLPQVRGGTWGPKPGAQSEIADCVLVFDDGMIANLSASRWGQRKIRDIRIVTEQLLIEVDLLRVNVTVYRHISQSLSGGDGRYRAETIIDVPYVRHRGEPLALQLESFVNLVRGGDRDAAEHERRTMLPPHVVAATMDAL